MTKTQVVVDYIQNHGPVSCREICAGLGMTYDGGKQFVHNVISNVNKQSVDGGPYQDIHIEKQKVYGQDKRYRIVDSDTKQHSMFDNMSDNVDRAVHFIDQAKVNQAYAGKVSDKVRSEIMLAFLNEQNKKWLEAIAAQPPQVNV